MDEIMDNIYNVKLSNEKSIVLVISMDNGKHNGKQMVTTIMEIILDYGKLQWIIQWII